MPDYTILTGFAPRIEAEDGFTVFTFDGSRRTVVNRSVRVTRYPIEDGGSAADHAVVEPIKIQVEGVMSATAFGRDPALYNPNRHINLAAELAEILERREIITLVTPQGVFPHLLLTSLPTEIDGYSVRGMIEFEEVRFAARSRVAIPPEAPDPEYEAESTTEVDMGDQPTEVVGTGTLEFERAQESFASMLTGGRLPNILLPPGS